MTPMVEAVSSATRAGSVTGPRSTHQTPSGQWSASSAAACAASRVLPAPPIPVSVTRRSPRASRSTVASSSALPTKLVRWIGRLWATASSERRGGKSAPKPSARSSTTALRVRQVSQPMRPQVDEQRSFRQRFGDHRRRRRRQQGLALVRDVAEPGATRQRRSRVVALVAQQRLAGVQSGPGLRPVMVGPGLGYEMLLDVEGGGHRVDRRAEHGDDGAVRAVRARGFGEQAVVCGHDRRHHVGSGRVGDQERHRPHRENRSALVSAHRVRPGIARSAQSGAAGGPWRPD